MTKKCIHHWNVAPAAQQMPATCRDCGAEKVFENEERSSQIQPSIWSREATGYGRRTRGSQN